MPFSNLNKVSDKDGGSLLEKLRNKDKFLRKKDVKIGDDNTTITLRPETGEIIITPKKDGTPIVITSDVITALGVAEIDLGMPMGGLRFEGGGKRLNPIGDKITSNALTPELTVVTVPPWEKALFMAKLIGKLGL